MTRVVLSFDNGPDPEVTPRVLDVLGERGIRAYFFVLGKQLARPDGLALARRIKAEGHQLGNHSYHHQTPLGEDPGEAAVKREIVATEELIGPLAEEPKLFRPFGGGGKIGPHLLSPEAARYLELKRYTCALWTSVPRDWEDPSGWPERALADSHRGPTEVMVLHDIPGACAAELPAFLDRARAEGITFAAELPVECLSLVGGVRRAGWSAIIRPR
jgi:peptidoglycan/xylan/chitin deacetylase (PgdA/CDA1 family)